MQLNIDIETGNIDELTFEQQKKLIKGLSIMVQTATNKIPKIEMKIVHGPIEEDHF